MGYERDLTDYRSMIREQRRCLKWSQTEYGDVVGVHQTTVSKWENGEEPDRFSRRRIEMIDSAVTRVPPVDGSTVGLGQIVGSANLSKVGAMGAMAIIVAVAKRWKVGER